MELNALNVRELTFEETIYFNGGSKVGDFLASVWETIQVVYQIVREKFIEWYENRMEAIETQKMELKDCGLMGY